MGERSSAIIKYEALNTKVKYENIDEFELGMYLRKNLTIEYINENGYDDILPKKVNDKTEERENREKEKDEDPYKYIEDIEELFDNDQIEYEYSYDVDRNSDKDSEMMNLEDIMNCNDMIVDDDEDELNEPDTYSKDSEIKNHKVVT